MSRFGWAFVNDVIIGTGSAGTGSAVDGPAHAVVVRDSGIVSGATNFIFNNSTGFGQLTGSLGITNNLSVTGNLNSGPFTTTTINATTNINSPSLTGSLRSDTGNKFGSSAGDVHQFTGSIRIAGSFISGSEARFGLVTGSVVTGSTLLYGNATINTANITTINSTTNTTNVLYVTGASNSIISGKDITGLANRETSGIVNPGSGQSIDNSTTFYIKPDGSKLYVHDTTGAEIITCTLSTPWDISTLTIDSTVLTNQPVASAVATGFTFKPDGRNAYILTSGPTNQELFQANLSIPWNLNASTTWTSVKILTGGGSITGQQGISISEDGRYLFTCSGSTTNSSILRYTMSTPWSGSTISHTSPISSSITIVGSGVKDIAVSNDGKSILILDNSNYLHDFELSAPYDLTLVTKKSSISLNPLTTPHSVVNAMFLKPDQTKIYFDSVNTTKHFISLTMSSSQVDLVGGIHITGDAKITQNINVYGDATFEDLSGSNAEFRILSASSVDINGGTIDGTTIGVTSATTGKFTELTASTHLSASQIFLGIGGMTASSNIIPFADNTYEIGSSTNKWKAVYVNGSVTGDSLSATSLTASQFQYNGATAAQVLIATASNKIAPTTLSGDVLISATGVTSINTGVIVNADISAGAAISHSKLSGITAGSVLMGNASNVPTATVVSGDVTINSSGTTAIASGVVVDADISATAAITHTKLANITAGSILMGNATNIPTATAITGDVTISNTGTTAIASGVIVDADINSGAAITHTKLANITAGRILMGNVSNAPTATAVTGDITIDSSGVTTIGTSKVTNTMLAGSITDSKLSTISTASKVSNSATTATELNTANAIVARDSSGNFTANSVVLSSSLTIKDVTDSGIHLDGDYGGNVAQASIGNGTTHAGALNIFTQASVTSASRIIAKLIIDEFDGTPNFIFVDPTGDLRIKNSAGIAVGSDGSAEGTIVGTQSFTGIHFYDIHDNEELEIGDVVVIENLKIKKSTIIKQKNVVGIFVGMTQHNTYKHSLTNDKSGSFAAIASVGDNRDFIFNNTITGFKICNQNGPVESGDLLCTSNIAGYLMKQDDDIIRSTTVGKALENVIFDSNGKATGIYGYLYCG